MVVRVGREEMIIRQRYEALSVTNDFLIAMWFIIGSVLFFSPATSTAGVWFFLLGSIELAIRPVIRLTRQLHLRRLPARARDTIQDF